MGTEECGGPRVTLSILVPHSTETSGTCGPLFVSLGRQTGFDRSLVELVVCDDGPHCPDISDAVSMSNLPARRISIPKGGPGGARNALFGASRGRYVMFCDADDGFCRRDGISTMLEAAGGGPDVITSVYMREGMDGNGAKPFYKTCHVHGKAFRRGFAEEVGARFLEGVPSGEDAAFCHVLVCFANNRGTLREVAAPPFYVWRYNTESVSRSRTYGQLREIPYWCMSVRTIALRHGPLRTGGSVGLDIASALYYAFVLLSFRPYVEANGEGAELYRGAVDAVAGMADGFDLSDIGKEAFRTNAKRAEDVVRMDFESSGFRFEMPHMPFLDWLDSIGVHFTASEEARRAIGRFPLE